MFWFNPVDTQCCFNVYSTSVPRRIDIETTSCVYREGDLFCVIDKVWANIGLHPNLRDLWNLIPLKYIRYLHKDVLLHRHGFLWKGYNFHWLKEILGKYSIKRMKELFSWLLYPIGCGSTTKIVYILQIYTTWIATNIKYHIRLLLTLLPYKHYRAVN